MSTLDEELAELGLDSYDCQKFKEALVEAKKKQRQSGGSAFDHFVNIIKRTASWIWDKITSFWDWLTSLF